MNFGEGGKIKKINVHFFSCDISIFFFLIWKKECVHTEVGRESKIFEKINVGGKSGGGGEKREKALEKERTKI